MSATKPTASVPIATTARESLPTESAASQRAASLSSGSESPLPSRRDFLKVGSVLAGALVVPQAATIRAALAAGNSANSLPVIGAGVVQLFVDYERVDAVQNIRRTLPLGRKTSRESCDPQGRTVGDREGDMGLDHLRSGRENLQSLVRRRVRTPEGVDSRISFVLPRPVLCDLPRWRPLGSSASRVVRRVRDQGEQRRHRRRPPRRPLPLGIAPQGPIRSEPRATVQGDRLVQLRLERTDERHLFHVLAGRTPLEPLARADRSFSSCAPGRTTSAQSATPRP